MKESEISRGMLRYSKKLILQIINDAIGRMNDGFELAGRNADVTEVEIK